MLSLGWALRAPKKDLRAALPMSDSRGEFFYFWEGIANYKGAANILLVAHIDRVFEDDTPKRVLWHPQRRVVYSPTGLGADDRAGVWAVWELRRRCGCAILLTDHEERGALGAREAATVLSQRLRGFDFFIEIDRRGDSQAVFYNGEPQEFRQHVCQFGFTEHVGTFSDISILGRVAQRCSVNLSAGYLWEHTREEVLYLDWLENTVAKATRLILNSKKGEVFYELHPQLSSYHFPRRLYV